MQLVFVVSGKSPKTMPGGLGAYSFNTARAVKGLGCPTYVVGFSERDELTTVEDIDVIHVKNPYEKLLGLGSFLMASRFAKAMLDHIDRLRPERVVVIGAGAWAAAGVALRESCRARGLPVRTYAAYFTTYLHEYDGHVRGAPISDYGVHRNFMLRGLRAVASTVLSPQEHRMLRESDGIIVHYESTKQLLLDEISGLRPERVHKIPYYIDLYERESAVDFQKPSADGVTRLNVVCRQDPRKGINTFLKALRILHDRGCPFQSVVAGSGVFLQANRRLAVRLGIDHKVAFPGFVPSVEEVLKHTDVYVLPSVEEGSGAISLLEAMRLGLAIVTTRCDGIPEDFSDGETGLLVDMGDAPGMANALERLVRDEELRKSLARNVRRSYAERFSFAAMKDGLSSIIASA